MNEKPIIVKCVFAEKGETLQALIQQSFLTFLRGELEADERKAV